MCTVLTCAYMSNSLGLQPTRLLCPWGFSRQEYCSGLPCPLQGIFLTQGSNPGLLHCRQMLYHLSHQGSPRILGWLAYPFSRAFPDPGIELGSPALQVDSLPAELPGELHLYIRKRKTYHSVTWGL